MVFTRHGIFTVISKATSNSYFCMGYNKDHDLVHEPKTLLVPYNNVSFCRYLNTRADTQAYDIVRCKLRARGEAKEVTECGEFLLATPRSDDLEVCVRKNRCLDLYCSAKIDAFPSSLIEQTFFLDPAGFPERPAIQAILPAASGRGHGRP